MSIVFLSACFRRVLIGVQALLCLRPRRPALADRATSTRNAPIPELLAALCSANLAGALERISKYVKLIAPMNIRLTRTSAQTEVSIDFIDPTTQPPLVFLLFKLVFFVQLAGVPAGPRSVDVDGQPQAGG